MTDECTSDDLGLLQLANGTVLHFNYEVILLYKLYYCGYSYYIFYDSKSLKKFSVEILELGLKTASSASPLPAALFTFWGAFWTSGKDLKLLLLLVRYPLALHFMYVICEESQSLLVF